MPTQHSKFFLQADCKDYAHPWTDSCVSATAGLGLHTFQQCLRIYSTVYVVTLLMRGKVPTKKDIKHTVLGFLQSTAFLSWSGFSYSMYICLLRKLLGNYNFVTVSFLPSFLSSLMAILIERPSRRSALCLYVSNIATETLFNMAVSRGYVSPIPYGQTYIFAVSTTLLLYFYRSKPNKQDSIYKIIRIIVGKHEDAVNLREVQQNENAPSADTVVDRETKSSKAQLSKQKIGTVFKAVQVYKQITDWLKALGKHACCPHSYSCAHYILTDGARIFGYGVCAQVVIKMVLQMRKLMARPQSIKSIIFKKGNLNLAIFLGGFASLYRLVSCSLRGIYKADSPYYAVPAGLIAGIAFTSYPDNTIALYFMWKALQLYWNDGVEKRLLPEVKGFMIFLYCFFTATLFHVAIVEATNLRPSYWKFLYNLSGGRIAAMSRLPLDVFGLDSTTKLQEVLRKTNTTDKHIFSF